MKSSDIYGHTSPLNLSPTLAKGFGGKWVAGARQEEDSERSERTGAGCVFDLGNEISTLMNRQSFQMGLFDSRLSTSSVSSRVLFQPPHKALVSRSDAFNAVKAGAHPLCRTNGQTILEASVPALESCGPVLDCINEERCLVENTKLEPSGHDLQPANLHQFSALAEACTRQEAIDGLASMLSPEESRRNDPQMSSPASIASKRACVTRQKLIKLFRRQGLIQKRKAQRCLLKQS